MKYEFVVQSNKLSLENSYAKTVKVELILFLKKVSHTLKIQLYCKNMCRPNLSTSIYNFRVLIRYRFVELLRLNFWAFIRSIWLEACVVDHL